MWDGYRRTLATDCLRFTVLRVDQYQLGPTVRGAVGPSESITTDEEIKHAACQTADLERVDLRKNLGNLVFLEEIRLAIV